MFGNAKKVIIVLVIFAIVFSALAVSITKGYSGTDTVNPPPGYSAITLNLTSLIPVQADVLLIQEILPWGSNANASVLSSLGYTYDIVNMSSVSTLNLSKYAFVLIASDQSQSFYDAYAANSTLFDDYVKNGGVLVVFDCYKGFAGGVFSAPLPGGVTTTIDYEANNLIVDSNHKIVTDELTEGIPLTNADLVGNWCSHTYFDNLDALVALGSIKSLNVIFKAKNSGKPTLIEYKVGKGIVIASGNTWEIAYDWDWSFATNSMDDVFAYAYMLGAKHTITASAGTGGTITPSGEVKVARGYSQTFTIKANLNHMIAQVLVDGNPIIITNGSVMSYTFTNVTSDHTISATFAFFPTAIIPPAITLPPNLTVPGGLTINTSTLTFTVSAANYSGQIVRLVVKVNGVVQIDKNNLDPITITLSEGVNTVDVTAYGPNGDSDTKTFKVNVDTKPPVISAVVPNTVSSNELTVKGNVYDTGTGVKILTINGNPIMNGEGDFEAKLTLSYGANTVVIEAIDNAGNKATQTFTVTSVRPSNASFIVILKVGSPTITVNGTSKSIDAQGSTPVIKDGKTLLPIRTLIESLGGTVEWSATEQKVTINLNGHSMVLWIGKTSALVDGGNTTLDVAPQIINGRTYLPLRFISEKLGASVNWDDKTQTITIYYWR